MSVVGTDRLEHACRRNVQCIVHNGRYGTQLGPSKDEVTVKRIQGSGRCGPQSGHQTGGKLHFIAFVCLLRHDKM